MTLKLIKSGQAKRTDGALFRCGRCGCTITVAAKVGGYVNNGKRTGATRMDVCAECLAAGRLERP